MLKIKKGDTVRVIAGKDKGKEGKVLSVADGKVVVEGVNTVTKHTKASQANPQGGIVTKEAALDASNVMYYDTKAKQASRIGYKVKEDGTKVRVSKKTGNVID